MDPYSYSHSGLDRRHIRDAISAQKQAQGLVLASAVFKKELKKCFKYSKTNLNLPLLRISELVDRSSQVVESDYVVCSAPTALEVQES